MIFELTRIGSMIIIACCWQSAKTPLDAILLVALLSSVLLSRRAA